MIAFLLHLLTSDVATLLLVGKAVSLVDSLHKVEEEVHIAGTLAQDVLLEGQVEE